MLSNTRMKKIFKLVHCQEPNKITINICPNWTLTEFIEKVKYEVQSGRYDFLDDIRDFVIIPTGQNTVNAEDGKPLENNDNIILSKKFYGDLNTVAFYIKPISGSIRNNEIIQDYQMLQFPRYRNVYISDYCLPIRYYDIPINCCICLENKIKYFGLSGCSHDICNECYIHCFNTMNLRCPLCREGIIENYSQTFRG